jgi:ATP-dependent DNA ligase
VALPLSPPIEPQLARSKPELPVGEGWCYEPKYDGFRCLAFVDGDDIYLQSRGSRPLRRYFPELAFPAGRYVLDGEIVIDAVSMGRKLGPDEDLQDFGSLQARLHPAESRVAKLALEIPARYVAFDLLAVGDDVLFERPLSERRALLAEFEAVGVALTPVVYTVAEAEPWLGRGEGVVAKELAGHYRPGARVGMVKVKRIRTIDMVVAGYRHGKEPGTVGSLILGLYDTAGSLHVVGHSSGLKAAEKKSLVARLAPYESGERGHGDPSRWASERDLEWVALRPELVVEITFDHASGGRIRHGTKIIRWREDKAPRECLLEQMEG